MARGYTLIELLTVIAIMATLYGIGVPLYRTLVEGSAVHAHVAAFSQAVHTSRLLAITRNQPVTLCALSAELSCSGDWGANLTMFYDRDRDGRLLAAGDRIADITIPDGERIQVRWQGFGKRDFLNARPNGSWRQNGRFTFCPRGAGQREGREIVINVAGRIRNGAVRCP